MRKYNVAVAKNFLPQNEAGKLDQIVNMWLDFAEEQARRRKQICLPLNDWEVLEDAWKINKNRE